jgi:hypothetical protein
MAAIDHEGPFSAGRIGLIFGKDYKAWPFRESQLVDVRRVGTNTIRTETEPGPVLNDWRDYADLDLVACIVEEHRGNESAAHQHFEDAMRMWDGKGFLDDAARHDRRYSTYKLGLAMLAAAHLSPPAKLPQNLFDRVLSLQEKSGGWVTDYDKTGKKIGLANVETTSLILLAIEAHVNQNQHSEK